MYQAHEFASLAGVTVRALHHYDRVGLLKPRRSKPGGYRLYTDRDLARLEQIVVLKFIGLPLKAIRDLLARDTAGLPLALHRQQTVLCEKRKQLDRAIQAIAHAEHALALRPEPDWQLFTQIIQEIAMEKDTEWTMRYFSDEAKVKVERRKTLWSPELQERVSREWAELFRDVEASLDEDPAGPKAQALAMRWSGLVGEFTGGDPDIQNGLNAMYADTPNWPDQRRQSFAIKPEVQDFIRRAMATSRRPEPSA